MIESASQNITKVEGDKAEFFCKARGMPSNITHSWFRDGVGIEKVEELESRGWVRTDGSLVIVPLTSGDKGEYRCDVTSGIGKTKSILSYLNVECKYIFCITYEIFNNKGQKISIIIN